MVSLCINRTVTKTVVFLLGSLVPGTHGDCRVRTMMGDINVYFWGLRIEHWKAGRKLLPLRLPLSLDSVSSSLKRFNISTPMWRAEQDSDPKWTSWVTMKSERVGGMCHNFSYFVNPNEESVLQRSQFQVFVITSPAACSEVWQSPWPSWVLESDRPVSASGIWA